MKYEHVLVFLMNGNIVEIHIYPPQGYIGIIIYYIREENGESLRVCNNAWNKAIIM